MPNTGKHYLGNKEWVGNADYTKLGEYNTKERALEILDEIQNILHPKLIITPKEDIKDFEVEMKIVPQLECDIKELSTYVYEMPKE